MGDMSTNRLGSPYTDELAAFHTGFDVERYLLAVIDAGAALREFRVLDLAGFDSMSPELDVAFGPPAVVVGETTVVGGFAELLAGSKPSLKDPIVAG